MRDLVIVIRCDGCGARFETEESLPEAFVTVNIAIGKDEREVDLCEACNNAVLAPVRQLMAVARKPASKPKSAAKSKPHRETPDVGDYACDHKGCTRVFTTAQGVGMHKRRVHVPKQTVKKR